jgi:flagellar protein FliO/FliZ
MQWFTNLPLGDKPALQIAALVGAAIVAIIVLIVVYRAFFGHRLRFSGGGKARQPRLGLVDAFSLDGQRQLVIVRRDNVEHLLMIGGPNDVVVESQIVRAQPQVLPRDKDAVAAPAAPKPAAPPPAQAPAKVAAAPAISPVRPASQPASVVASAPVRPPNRSEPTLPSPVRAPQPQAGPQPQPAAPTGAAKAQTTVEAGDTRAPPKPLVLPLRSSAAPPPKSSPLPPPIVVSPAPAAPPATPTKSLVIPMPPPAPAQKAPAQPASAPPSTAGAKNDPFAGLDSLEAEMARLLGRDP